MSDHSEMDQFQLLIDLHRDGSRQGPGGDPETRKALNLAGLDKSRHLRVADIGCGTGASTLVLAQDLDAEIQAVDLFPEFLEILQEEATQKGLQDRIQRLACSMDALPFEPQTLDAIWSEGAVYNIGFENGIDYWRQFLKPGGILAVSELSWFTQSRPDEIQAHWEAEYPGIDCVSGKIAALERLEYKLLGYFPLPVHCWLDNYYNPLEARFSAFLTQHQSSQQAQAIVEMERQEIALYKQYKRYYGYGFYIAQKNH